MTQEEIELYNEKCAKFLKIHKFKDNTGDLWDVLRTGKEIYSIRTHLLAYHSDWNCIMEVLSKIEESHHTVISQGITGHYININREDVNVLTETLDNPSKFMGSGETKKEAVIKAIDKFLTWYEQNKQI